MKYVRTYILSEALDYLESLMVTGEQFGFKGKKYKFGVTGYNSGHLLGLVVYK